MNRTITLCFSLYPIALPFGYVLIYTFYHYAVLDANSNLIEETDWINTAYFLYKRKGKTVYIRRNNNPSVTANTIFKLGTLPEGYRPKYAFPYVCYGFENGGWVYRRFTVETTGEITLITSASTNYIIPFFFSFIVDI